jgi:hypothetical protein
VPFVFGQWKALVSLGLLLAIWIVATISSTSGNEFESLQDNSPRFKNCARKVAVITECRWRISASRFLLSA